MSDHTPHVRDEDIAGPWHRIESEVIAAATQQRIPDPEVFLGALQEAADSGYRRGHSAGVFQQGMREAHRRAFVQCWERNVENEPAEGGR